LDTTNSTFNFVSVKNTNTAEAFTFTQLKGTVATNGTAVLTIPLSTISTGNDTRNSRIQSMLFESSYLPSLHFTTDLDLSALDSLAVGSIQVQTITGNLILHGVVKSISFDATIVKHSSTSISVSPRRPIIISSGDFDLNAGVEALRAIVGATNITERSPVYFKMFLNRESSNSVAAIVLPSAPSTPASFTGTISQVSAAATLNWSDVSNDETGFSVRRKGADGRWTTLSNLASNTSSYIDSLLDVASDTYNYKVISYKDSIPSAAPSLVTLVYSNGSASSTSSGGTSSTGATSSRSSTSSTGSVSSGSASSTSSIVGNATNGAALWNSRSCAGCHGVDGEKNADGTPVVANLNPNRSMYRHSQDTQDRSLRDFIAKWMPAFNAGSCTGQCAADLEAYIWTWRKPSDGIPDNPVSNFSCPTSGPTYGQRTLRLLTKSEYQRSVRDLVGYNADLISLLPDDFIAGSFANNNTLQVDKTRYTSYLSNAERIATDVSSRWSAVLSCTPNESCAQKLVTDLAPRIFRRPLSSTESSAYLAVAKGTADGREVSEGMKIALTAMLSSPQFLYRSEIGESSSTSGVYKLTGYEMATYMAYTYTGTTPTTTLMSVAANGGLDTAAGIRQQAATLLNTSNTKVLLGDFVNRWLGTESLEIKEKTNVANFATLAGDMKLELGKNFAQAMLNSSSTFASVYNPSYTFVNQRLASLYGLTYNSSGADSDGFVSVSASDRGGILLSGAFLSRYATNTDANMVTRAVAVRRKMMCQDIPEPPSGVSLDREALAARDKEFFEDPKTTPRMAFEHITAGTSCSNCHAEIINPLGATMENYDNVGRVRSVDLKGNAIDASGTFFSPYPQLQFLNDPDRVLYSPSIQFTGGKGLARTITEDSMVSSLARTCLATQFMSYSSGINSLFLIDTKRDVGYTRISSAEESAYRCDISDLNSVLTSKGPRAMLEEIPALDSVMYRKEWSR
jgi:cytochrome c553/polyisoprenoid-binding protein YceI